MAEYRGRNFRPTRGMFGGRGRGEHRQGDNARGRVDHSVGFRGRRDHSGFSARGRGQHSAGSGYQHSVSKRTKSEASPITLEAMQMLLQKQPSEVMMSVAAPSTGFVEALQSGGSSEKYTEHVLLVLQKLCETSGMTGTLAQLLKRFTTSGFVTTTLIPYLTQHRIRPSSHENHKYYMAVCKLLVALLEHIPAFSSDHVTMILGMMQEICRTVEDAALKCSLESKLKQVESLQQDVIKQIHGGTLTKETTENLDEEDIEPPDNFRQISIIPGPQDLRHNIEIFLRKNRIYGSYKDADQYLDIQFRLLREDYMMPLRQGIQEIIRSSGKKINEKYIQDVRIYNNVRNKGNWYSEKGIVYRFNFDISSLKRVKWEISHRLIYGSLVCLSSDNFRTIAVGTVTERDPKLLKKGLIDILIHDSNLLDPSPYVTYKMVECSAYFEAYRYNLEGLQELNEKTLPFQPYLLGQEADKAQPPRYLVGHEAYFDFKPLLKKGTFRSSSIRVLDKSEWPKAEALGLDGSQYKALQHAVTREFSIIQGPPGTGKTYIGLKIVQLLLYNFARWGRGIRDLHQRQVVNHPILIVCFTNHALDQFLEGILDFADHTPGQIVRVGGRCSSENPELVRCLMSKLKRDDEVRCKVPSELKEAKSAILEQMKSQEEYLSQLGQMHVFATTQVIQEQFLYHMMLPHHRDTFEQLKDKQSHIMSWLLGANPFGEQWSQDNDGVEFWDDGVENWDDGAQSSVDSLSQDVDISQTTEYTDFDDADALEVEEERRMMDSDEERDEKLGEKSKRMLNMKNNASSPSHNMQHTNNLSSWQTVTSQKRLKQTLKGGLRAKSCMPEEEEGQVPNIWLLNPKQRWMLYRLWIKRYCADCTYRMQGGMEQYNQLAKQLHEVRDEEEFYVLQNARIIAMTTTGAAKYRHLLRRIQPRIVVVEEAAEVLEAHIVTSLSENCQQLILIGDHQQLRPNPTVYKLARNYHLDVSLFERMLRNNMHCETLGVQHRMRPEIAKLIVPHIYKSLVNHDSVKNYSNVPGIGGNLFFVNHSHVESETFDTRSHFNIHEANYLAALCKYLIQQGFEPSQITILTTYRGQMYEIKKKTKAQEITADVRVTPVDNYQGEENDVILLSLVRSNEEGKVGFIKIANRVCVALSRAREGFYVIGNMELIRTTSKVWRDILTGLQADGKLVSGIPLFCQNHPNTAIVAKDATDFAKAPEGGCNKPCEFRLKCGHVCEMRCHPFDRQHEKYQCKKPCTKTPCKNKHKCPKRCCEDCGKCEVLESATIPKCGHLQYVPCYLNVSDFKCQAPCKKEICFNGHTCPRKCSEKCLPSDECMTIVIGRTWPCGHKLNIECHKTPSNYPCPEQVERELPCQHTTVLECSSDVHSVDCKQIVSLKLCDRGCKNDLPCYMKEKALSSGCKATVTKTCDINPQHTFNVQCSEFDVAKCKRPCGAQLECGHICQGTCGDCNANHKHKQCCLPCQRLLACSHQCQGRCGEICSSCRMKCTKVCPHGMCRKPCGDACFQCKAPCTWVCEHQACTRRCSEPCDRDPCEQPCPKRFRCSHPCSGYCGELCPAICPRCQGRVYQQVFKALGITPQKKERYVVLQPCNHVVPSSYMDTFVQDYEALIQQQPRELKLLQCPLCKMQMHFCPRYQRAIRNSQKEYEKLKAACNQSHKAMFGLEAFEKTSEITQRLQEFIQQTDSVRYAKKCMGCIRLLGETSSLISRTVHAKDKPNQSVVRSLQDAQAEFKKDINTLVLEDFNKKRLAMLSYQIKVFFILCHARYMITYIRNPHKQRTLAEIVSSTNDAKTHSSKLHLKYVLERSCRSLESTIPEPLRNGIHEYMSEINKIFNTTMDLHLDRKWIICRQGHVFAVSTKSSIRPEREDCPHCRAEGADTSDTSSDEDDGRLLQVRRLLQERPVIPPYRLLGYQNYRRRREEHRLDAVRQRLEQANMSDESDEEHVFDENDYYDFLYDD